MMRTGWKWLGRAAAGSAILLVSAAASAQPNVGVAPATEVKALPRLEMPKIDVHAQVAAPLKTTTIDRATAVVIRQVLDSMHRVERQVPAASVQAPVATRRVVSPAAKQAQRARPAPQGFTIEPKPILIEPPSTATGDTHGQSAILPGIQVRLPWRIP